MIVYEPLSKPLAQDQLTRMVIPTAKHLFPNCDILSTTEADGCFLSTLRNREKLTGLALYPNGLTNDHYELILKLMMKLEEQRKFESDPTLSEIELNILALGFARNLMRRMTSSVCQVRLFTWSLINSGDNVAILLRDACDLRDEADFGSDATRASESAEEVSALKAAEGMSHAELIAFTQFDKELRDLKPDC